ncbi:hypothetical protein TZ01_06700 [Acidiplasma sp. MBA-1]|nr:hypothetical protein TZ01_06700 [Acidiplasma sp. MBA-1]
MFQRDNLERRLIYLDLDSAIKNTDVNINNLTGAIERILLQIFQNIPDDELIFTIQYSQGINYVTGKNHSLNNYEYSSMLQGYLGNIIQNTYEKIKYELGLSREMVSINTRIIYDRSSMSILDIPERNAIGSLASDGYIPVAMAGTAVSMFPHLQYFEYAGINPDIDAASSFLSTLLDADEYLILYDFNNLINRNLGSKINNINNYLVNRGDKNTLNKLISIKGFLDRGGKKASIHMPDNFNDCLQFF